MFLVVMLLLLFWSITWIWMFTLPAAICWPAGAPVLGDFSFWVACGKYRY